MENLKQIASFSVDHDKITKGMYLSRVDGNIYTYDLRTRVPNGGEYMDNLTMHSVEHLAATVARNAELGSKVIYFGPMGCQTGFYLLLKSVEPPKALEFAKEIFRGVKNAEKMVGDTRSECGNYRNLSLSAAKREASNYLKVLESITDNSLSYKE